MKKDKLIDRVENFLDMFEVVFDNDWDHTKMRIDDPNFIRHDGSFLSPGVDDIGNNWANRESLIDSYNGLKELLRDADR